MTSPLVPWLMQPRDSRDCLIGMPRVRCVADRTFRPVGSFFDYSFFLIACAYSNGTEQQKSTLPLFTITISCQCPNHKSTSSATGRRKASENLGRIIYVVFFMLVIRCILAAQFVGGQNAELIMPHEVAYIGTAVLHRQCSVVFSAFDKQ